MSKIKDFLSDLMERYQKEHVGMPEKEIDEILHAYPNLELWSNYMKRPIPSHCDPGPYKKILSVWIKDEDEKNEIQFNIHKQLMRNKDYQFGEIVVSSEEKNRIDVYISNAVEHIPGIFI